MKLQMMDELKRKVGNGTNSPPPNKSRAKPPSPKFGILGAFAKLLSTSSK
jgi:hypothetical protein